MINSLISQLTIKDKLMIPIQNISQLLTSKGNLDWQQVFFFIIRWRTLINPSKQ